MAPVAPRKSFSAGFKVEVLKFAKEKSNCNAARHYGISESNIRNWRKLEDSLSRCKKSKKANRGGNARWPQLENLVEKWILDQGSSATQVNSAQICEKARELAEELHILDFSGCPSWCFRFMRRRKQSLRTDTSVCQTRLENCEEEIVRFGEYCAKVIAEYNISDDYVINIAEVPITLHMPFRRTVDLKGSCDVKMEAKGNVESCFTLVLAITAAGTKLPPMVIFKCKTRQKEEFPPGITVQANEDGEMDSDMFKRWIDRLYNKRTGGLKRNKHALLIMNSSQALAMDDIKALLNTNNITSAIIPKGLTKLLQPMDRGIIQAFETDVKTLWEDQMSDAKQSFIKTGRFRIATYSQLCEWILSSWESITTECIKQGFRTAGVGRARNDLPADGKEQLIHDLRWQGLSLTSLFNSDTEDEQFDGF